MYLIMLLREVLCLDLFELLKVAVSFGKTDYRLGAM